MARAALVEVFDSIQGEGRFVGMPMAFVRIATCPIRCRYCDTPGSYEAAATFEVRDADLSALRREPNPAPASRVLELVAGLRQTGDLVVSVTGGEPLSMPAFVGQFAGLVRAAGGRTHLETAALDPGAMAQVVGVVDHVSADYKLPGTLQSGDPRPAHRECFDLVATSESTLDIKIVLTPDVAGESGRLEQTIEELTPWRDHATLILQPVTPFGEVTASVSAHTLSTWSRAFESDGFEVRVIPQTHKALGID